MGRRLQMPTQSQLHNAQATFFRAITKAKEKLQVQGQMNRLVIKIIQEVYIRWKFKVLMLKCLFEQIQSEGAALAMLRADMRPLSSEDNEIAAAYLQLLSPFYQATVELSKDRRLLGWKIIPVTKNVSVILLWNNGKQHSWTTGAELGVSNARQVWNFGEPNSTDPFNTAGF